MIAGEYAIEGTRNELENMIKNFDISEYLEEQIELGNLERVANGFKEDVSNVLENNEVKNKLKGKGPCDVPL